MAFSLTLVFHCLSSCLCLANSHCMKKAMHTHTHTRVNIDAVCFFVGRCFHAKWDCGWTACRVWECVFSFPCVVALRLLSVLLRQLVTGLSLPVSLCVTLPISLLGFLSIIDLPSSFFISLLPSNPSRPSLSAALFFPFRLSPISSSALWQEWQEPIHISHLTQHWAWKSHFSLTKWRNLSR